MPAGETRFIFITGGVVSSLGKGIAAVSIGRLLVSRGFRVQLQKFDPYINVDPGTMSPFQHGEVFVGVLALGLRAGEQFDRIPTGSGGGGGVGVGCRHRSLRPRLDRRASDDHGSNSEARRRRLRARRVERA